MAKSGRLYGTGIAYLRTMRRILGVTAEALRAKVGDRKSAIFRQRGLFDPKFQVEGDVPTNLFA